MKIRNPLASKNNIFLSAAAEPCEICAILPSLGIDRNIYSKNGRKLNSFLAVLGNLLMKQCSKEVQPELRIPTTFRVTWVYIYMHLPLLTYKFGFCLFLLLLLLVD